ncbi:hypothetical protein CTI12_AA593570 [Artemisia annua]|uniref:Uncharacterized protein n=1 Tax=Artemisia annua TaxID=35608 RepID=A0A2U1KK06_ARTAN|nr:hypothetical protein CTI12_AA593570 [Artemisia annua]
MTNMFFPNPGIVPHASNPNLWGRNIIIVHSISSYAHTRNSVMVSLSKEFFNDVAVNLIPYDLHTKSILTDIEYGHISTGILLTIWNAST